jgi:hypothetical protein
VWPPFALTAVSATQADAVAKAVVAIASESKTASKRRMA